MSVKIRQMARTVPIRASSPLLFSLTPGLLLLLFISVLAVSASPTAASPEAVKWTRVNIPTEGTAGNWVLADGSDVRYLTMANDGTLYAYCPGLTYTLYRSGDGGNSWTHVGEVKDTLVGIAISPADNDIIYYATAAAVYRSTDSGRTFSSLPPNPGGAGASNLEITSLDVTWLDHNIIAVGTRDADSSEFGGVYTLDEVDIVPTWTDTGIGSYDVYAVAFSPHYPSDRQIIAVVTDETDTLITSKSGDAGWGITAGNARLNRDNSASPTPVAVAAPAVIAFPDNYNAEPASGSGTFFVAIDTGAGNGDVYKITASSAPDASMATDLNIAAAYGQNNIDITGLSVQGDYPSAILLAGAADSARTYLGLDGGTSWTRSRKEPTGESQTYVLMANDFISSGTVYAATSGDGSAFSISRDIGETWNQLGLIDTTISTIVDLAPSPAYQEDSTIFMLTFGGGHSLWRSRNGGLSWERILASALPDVDSLSLVALPPQYGHEIPTVFAAGQGDGTPAVWESTDGGQNFRRRFTRDPDSGTAFSVDAWTIIDENTLLAGSYNGSGGMVYTTTNSGFFYTAGVPAGGQSLHSLAISPNYEQDGIILAGNTSGWVYWSEDYGASFQSLPADASSAPFTGSITVAFDPDFENNRTVYAASAAPNGGVSRFITGTSSDWESIDSTLPSGAMLNQITVGSDGTLYAANSDADGGLERSLNPTFSLGPSFETVTRGLGDGATLTGLWRSGNRLWSADTASNRLMTFQDTLTSAVVPTSPDDEAAGTGSLIDGTVRNVTLNWETLDGATGYRWQLDYEADFSSIPSGFEGTSDASSVRLPALEPATTYYWRVRAESPFLSPWSEKWTFTTSLDTEVIALKPESPAPGASQVPVKPVFQWAAVAGADAYELLVSTAPDYSYPAIVKTGEYALPTNAWRCDVSLDYDTTYYWKVRAISNNTHSTWSASGVFTTESAPVTDTGESATPPPQRTLPPLTTPTAKTPLAMSPPAMQIQPTPTPPPPPPPLAPPAPAAGQTPDTLTWLIYLIGGLLMTIILAMIIILTMVLKIKRF